MKNQIYILMILLVLMIAPNAGADDKLDRLIEEYSSAKLIELEIRIEVVSEIFNSVDTVTGEISIADDGRYLATINNDRYLFDGNCIWEYSADNNQATKDCLKTGEHFESELIFIKNLDRYFDKIKSDDPNQFSMKKNDSGFESLPDSLSVIMHNGYYELQYYDLNDDLNIITILKEKLLEKIGPSQFELHLPDSTEIILMP